ncbi:NCS2 family permease [uncultured Vagococcus sp.]|uniref:NCS2 family permease n=1 Tax=uncultured Vagococcus sp. TaxID=189676 RepID=UPI0028D649CB|nr:NCS2 family permease [uncultured Vagococcus sp.]
MDRFFKLTEQGTTVKTEIAAGFTTFLTMSYIIIVNPAILTAAGIPANQVFMATIISAVIASGWMGLVANYPIAIAPGLGLNAYFVSVVATGVDYKTAFSSVFIAGIIFLLLSLTSFREKLILSIPESLKSAISAGIGLFIAFVGLRLSSVIIADPINLVKLGDLHSPTVLLTLFGLMLTVILLLLNVPGAIFVSMVIIAIVAFATGQVTFDGFISLPRLGNQLMITNPIKPFKDIVNHSLYGAVLSFLLITIFDTTGTMIGVAKRAGLMKDGNLPRAKQALFADALGTTVGSIFGTSPTTAYIESGTGVAVGGRTGLTAVVVAFLFFLSSFFYPIVSVLASVPAITSPALIIVGSMMIGEAANINWDDFSEAFPAFLVIIAMPLTSSIATGLALGFMTYPITKFIKKESKEVHPLIYLFAVLFFIQLFILGGH